jgi:transitional endoplasmic reticulum ATPase
MAAFIEAMEPHKKEQGKNMTAKKATDTVEVTVDKPVARTKVHVVDVVRHGQQIIVPEDVTYEIAIEQLQRKIKEEQERVQIREVLPGFLWEGAFAFYKAMQQMFGWASGEVIKTLFGEQKPMLVSVEIGVGKKEMVPFGRFSLPGIEGWVQTGWTVRSDSIFCEVVGEVKRKHEKQMKTLFEKTRELMKAESIYRGQAIRVNFPDLEDIKSLDDVMPRFIDLGSVNQGALIYSEQVQAAIATNLFTPIERSEECRLAGIPLKRGILLSGPYGTGKTLAAYVTAAKCIENGWTFIYCDKADELKQAVRLAHDYQPAAIFCEDIDRAVSGERDVDMDDILNIIDGIESKATEIMVILTTNFVENINKAMLRPGRLDAVINVLPPDALAVEKLVRLYGKGLVDPKADLKAVGGRLAGQIPAVIRECVERAKLSAIKVSEPGAALVITGEAMLDAAEGMKNQLDLLNGKINDPQKEVHRDLVGRVLEKFNMRTMADGTDVLSHNAKDPKAANGN